ncbi:MAG: methyltransferase [Cyanobacteria bacterium P01_H01_bin.35]
MSSDTMALRVAQLMKAYDKQPYTTEFDGFQLKIGKGVFPTDVSFATLKLGHILGNYHPECALDMGCGCGYLALVMRRNGVPKVYAVDLHPPAIECVLENIRNNPEVSPIEVCQSDLFQEIEKKVVFDLMVFNHFYRPGGTAIFGENSDGGKDVFQRFLSEAKHRLNAGGVILTSFVKMSDPENDPQAIAIQEGFNVRTLLTEENYMNMGDLFIYEISLGA